MQARFRFFFGRMPWFFLDLLLLALALAASYALRFNFSLPEDHARRLVFVLPFALSVETAILAATGATKTQWRYFSLADIPGLLLSAGLSAAVFLLARLAAPGAPVRFYPPISVTLVNAFVSASLLSGARWLARIVFEGAAPQDGGVKRVLVAGADAAGAAICRSLLFERPLRRKVVGFLDDSPSLAKTTVLGIPVVGRISGARPDMPECRADEIIVSPGIAAGGGLRALSPVAARLGARLVVAPEYSSMLERQSPSQLRYADISDLLRRPEIMSSPVPGSLEYLKGRRVLVTGAGGSIGSELSRQLLSLGVESLVLAERSELALFNLERELLPSAPPGVLKSHIADIRDAERIDAIFERERPEIVFHAAAYKHVPVMERNVSEAVLNNIGGTRVLAEAALKARTERFVLLSSDKAVNPSSVMGATKRICERMMASMNGRGDTVFSAVRFGNVLGSTGSVVPIFKEAIEHGGPVPVTHPEMTRYFMTIPEAVRLTLEAAAMGDGAPGRIFVLDMGEPVRIADLASDMIRLAGKRPGEDVKIAYTGIRDGEKLREELHEKTERLEKTDNMRIFSIAMDGERCISDAECDGLISLARTMDDEALRKMLLPAEAA